MTISSSSNHPTRREFLQGAALTAAAAATGTAGPNQSKVNAA
jgi:hypothetical protein